MNTKYALAAAEPSGERDADPAGAPLPLPEVVAGAEAAAGTVARAVALGALVSWRVGAARPWGLRLRLLRLRLPGRASGAACLCSRSRGLAWPGAVGSLMARSGSGECAGRGSSALLAGWADRGVGVPRRGVGVLSRGRVRGGRLGGSVLAALAGRPRASLVGALAWEGVGGPRLRRARARGGRDVSAAVRVRRTPVRGKSPLVAGPGVRAIGRSAVALGSVVVPGGLCAPLGKGAGGAKLPAPAVPS